RIQMRHFRLLSLLLVGMASTAMGQVVTATLYGTVLDPNGAVVPNATVTALNVGRGISTVRQSDAAGEVVLSSLPVGDYTITVEVPGFKSLRRTGIALSAGQDLR